MGKGAFGIGPPGNPYLLKNTFPSLLAVMEENPDRVKQSDRLWPPSPQKSDALSSCLGILKSEGRFTSLYSANFLLDNRGDTIPGGR